MAASTILPPPTERYGLLGWLHKNLFNNWFNTLLTIFSSWFIFVIFRTLLNWVFIIAEWEVVWVNLRLFLVGQYPVYALWRLWLAMYILAGIIGLALGIWAPSRKRLVIVLLLIPLALTLLPVENSVRISLITSFICGLTGWLAGLWQPKRLKRTAILVSSLYFIVFIILVRGLGKEGTFFAVTPSNLWGGLLLTSMLTVVGIVFSFPIGVLLALGRRSNLPLIKWISIAYIEIVRGVPLITILFMAQLMLPLFLPAGLTIDRVIRAMVGITLFSAAYLAENVRGGLQAIPQGQYEASQALGLKSVQMMVFIILPQALRAIIPILVGQFIALFKDTTLVAIVGLFDVLGIGRTVLAQPAYIGRHLEVYIFISGLFFVFSYVISYLSQRLEVQLGVGER